MAKSSKDSSAESSLDSRKSVDSKQNLKRTTSRDSSYTSAKSSIDSSNKNSRIDSRAKADSHTESNAHTKSTKSNFVAWLPVISLTCAAFIFNTSEFIPIGLLSAISTDFGMSEASAGWLITIYAWVVALASLPLMLIFSNAELKKLMLCVMALFVASHALSTLSQSYAMLMTSRIGVALSHALFWSIASPMAIRAAPEGKSSSALGFIVTGTSLAMIAGLPLGRALGLYVDWRTSFGSIGALAFAILVLFWRVFPTMPSTQKLSLSILPSLAKNKRFAKIIFLTALIFTANFTAYSYIEPFLAQIANLSAFAITSILGIFGACGVVASVVFSKYYDKHHFVFVNICLFGVVLALLALHFGAIGLFLSILVCAFWGFAFMCYLLVFQSQTIAAVPQATTIAMSILSGTCNVGIGLGAFVGGLTYAHLGAQYIGYVGGVIALCGAIFYLRQMPFARVFNRYYIRRKG